MNPEKPSEADKKNVDFIRSHYPKEIIHLGIAMAGAVSAGAYSAGAMHYLLTTLDLWEKLKQQNYAHLSEWLGDATQLNMFEVKDAIQLAVEKLKEQGTWIDVDMHDVRLEIMAGSSAGSLVTAIAALSLGYEQEALTFDTMIHQDESKVATLKEVKSSMAKNEGKYNMLFDSWVNLNDGGDINDSVLGKLLNVDLKTEMQMPFSLLNGSVLDKVREHQLKRIFDDGPKSYPHRDKPAYVSDDLKVLFSLTLLQGIPLSVNFQNSDQTENDPHPAHRMRRHSYMARFALKPEKNKESLLDIRNKVASLELINAALASGAFPIGLPPRKLLIPPAQLDSFLKIPGLEKSSRIKSEVSSTYPPEQYIVDGGVLNNEPIMEVYNHLMNSLKDDASCSRREIKGLLLIDPFPNFEVEPDVALDGPDTLSKVLSGLLGALRGQGMMKDISALADDDANKELIMGMISPSRKNAEGQRVQPAIASSAMEGFAGFIERDFRLHDFYLGMKNAQSFFNNFFQIRASKSTSFIDGMKMEKGSQVLPDLKKIEMMSNPVASSSKKQVDLVPSKTPDEIQIMGKEDWSHMESAIKFGTIEYPRYHQKQLLSLRTLIVKRIFFLLGHRLFHSKPPSGKQKWKMTSLKWSNRLWKWPLFALIFGAIAGLGCVLGAQYFWLFFLIALLLVGLTFYAIVQLLANRCLQGIGEELHNHNLLK